MRRNARYPRYPRYPRPKDPAPRRGNSIVLVMGILVLLVIIATALITRTHAGRVTAGAAVRSALRDDNARVIAEMLAAEIAEALFPRPIDPADPALPGVGNSNFPRLSVLNNPVRYGVDQDFDADGLPDFPYNLAPYHVVPFTNWPDGDPVWPIGPGNLGGAMLFEGNPVGNPGFGDTRWLADIEPLRYDSTGDGILDTFSHWRHMTNIARPNNGWRIVGDISDVEFLLVFDLGIPVEQQLTVLSDAFNVSTNLPSVTGDFFERWQDWFTPPVMIGDGYIDAYTHPAEIPPNFLNLKDLDGDERVHEDTDFGDNINERPEHEFEFGTARWNVGRVLADTDGDGFTDSFWFLAPTMTERGIRQIVAVRIIDNSAMLNVNVATRFIRNDTDFGPFPDSKTAGHTPADLALVGQLLYIPPPGALIPPNWNVGFYDNLANWFVGPDNDQDGNPDYETRYDLPESPGDDYPWKRHVLEVGLFYQFGVQGEAPNQLQRLDYWRRAGLTPLGPPVGSGYTPFTLAEELELRMLYGNNSPWIFSRYEFTTQSVQASSYEQFLRAGSARGESSEYLDQLSNRELVFDHRRNLTMYNGARNDQMPPWLWWRWNIPSDIQVDADNNPGDDDGNGVSDVIDRFLAQARTKLDLRESGFVGGPPLPLGERTFSERLAPTLLLILIDGDGASGDSYFGPYTGDPAKLETVRLAAAGLAANIRAYRDEDSNVSLADAEPLPELAIVGPDEDFRMLGMERQPFLLEAFLGHVYKAVVVPDADEQEVPYDNSGNHVILEDPDLRSTVIAVQLANPFDQPIDLALYEVSLFGQVVELGPLGLGLGPLAPATPENPVTLVLYVLEDTLQGDALQTKWLDFMDLAGLSDLPSGSMVVEVGSWSTNRQNYDGNAADAIELRRRDPITNDPVVIDRIDPPAATLFADAVTVGLAGDIPPDRPDPENSPPGGQNYPGIDLGPPADGYDHWVQWVRVTRAWGFDIDANLIYDFNERNPRYVIGNSAIVAPTAAETPDGSFIAEGNKYKFDDDPDSPNPWFARNYQNVDGFTVGRKPTFFDMNHSNDPANPSWSYPNKGWYGQGLPGDVDLPSVGSTLDFAMQMLQKDGDFEQVGELLNVWMFGHQLQFDEFDAYVETTVTFSEFMIDEALVGTGARVNRLTISPVIGKGDPMNPLDPLHAVPALPAGLRVLDAFVCDDGGINPGDVDGDGTPNTPNDIALARFGNANGFSGKMTPGMINVNTAPPEVMRAAPHMTKLIHEENSLLDNPFVRVPEATVRYRERFGDPMDDMDLLPAYGDRGAANFLENPDLDDLRGDRGFASIGEVLLLTREATFSPPLGQLEPNENWLIDFAGLRPPAVGPPGGVESRQISTDVNDVFDPNLPGDVPDEVAQDAEELNLLFAGMSNMITTRSDVFTVYFKVRSFKQNPITGVWDATNPEFIVDDSRYVMLVDRSEVNHPNDKPKILYLEKLPK